MVGDPCLSPAHIVRTTVAKQDSPSNMTLQYKELPILINEKGNITLEEDLKTVIESKGRDG